MRRHRATFPRLALVVEATYRQNAQVALKLSVPTSSTSGPPQVSGRASLRLATEPRRLGQLLAGLLLYGVSSSLLLRAGFGVEPWGVFHLGLSRHTGIAYGTVSIVVGVFVLLLWWPIRQRPGVGTVLNVIVIGLAIDATLAVLPTPRAVALRLLFLAAGILGNGIATGSYIGAGLGPGPRDGLMTGLARRTGASVRAVRTGIELTVLVTGFFLGGTVGIGTLFYAVAIGPLAQVFIPLFTPRRDR